MKNTHSLAKRKFLLLVSTMSEYLPNYLIGQFSTSLIFMHQEVHLFSPLKQSEERSIKLAFSESCEQNIYNTPRYE